MHAHSPFSEGSLKKKIRPLTLIVLVLGRVEKKCPKKESEKLNNIFFVSDKYQDETLVSIFIF